MLCLRMAADSVCLLLRLHFISEQSTVGDQSGKRQHYLSGYYMMDFNNETLAIANAWLDPEVFTCFLIS